VVGAGGRISLSGSNQQLLLEAEGVAFDDASRIDLNRFGWVPR
jgi:alkylated DNA nucleotide flippase Atl1